MINELPLIDLSAVEDSWAYIPERLVDEVAEACEHTGFMLITGHGVPHGLVADLRRDLREYFAQPLEQKLRHKIRRDNYRGYIPLGFFSPNVGGLAADCYEGYKLHREVGAQDPVRKLCELYGPNIWPAYPAELRGDLITYWQACDHISVVLLRALAIAMGISSEDFLGLFEQALTNMTLLHYPATDKAVGIHPHKDTDALTILAPDPVGGLRLRLKGRGEWLEVNSPPEALVVNIGDLLECWSGGRFVSTPHKVENRSGQSRYSFPYFCVPSHDVVVRPLITPQAGFSREAVPVGDVSRAVWQSNWLDAKPEPGKYQLGTLENTSAN